MRRSTIVAVALLVASAMGPSQARQASDPANGGQPAPRDDRAPAVRIAFAERGDTAARGEAAMCANLAAARARDAKALGADYAAQDRILGVTFVLCMAEPRGRRLNGAVRRRLRPASGRSCPARR